MSTLNPKMQALVELFAEAKGFPEMTAPEAREASEAGIPLAGDGPAVDSVEEIEIPTGHGHHVGARVYRPTADEPTTVVIWFHGGGWVIGSPKADDAICRTIAAESGALVVNADYRHAPEEPFPAATDDAFAVLRWVDEHLAGGRPIVLSGSSAGANLATVSALRAKEADGPAVALQVLIYPVTDHDFETPSYVEFAAQPPLGRGEMEWFWGHYVPDVADRDHPYASPLKAEDLSGLPPAYLTVAGADPLYSEGLAYADALKAAGVEVTVREDADVTHGYVNFLAAVDTGNEVLTEIAALIRAIPATPRGASGEPAQI
ncbi:MAG: alpha/beta hydrolase [Solirubrobacteraceae bacterium]|nr:alpha/beta hydrolase [Patulibacter sp.]